MTHNLEIFCFQTKQIKENFRFILIFSFRLSTTLCSAMVKGQERVFEATACTTFQHFYFPKLIFVFSISNFLQLDIYYTLYRYTALQMKKQVRWKDRIWLVFPFKRSLKHYGLCMGRFLFFFNPIILNISLHILLNRHHLGFKLCQQDNKSLPASIRKKSTLMDDALADPY